MRVVATLLLFCMLPVQFSAVQATETAALAPSWTLKTADGAEVTFPGNRHAPSILLFWATWCPYCKALMPHLQSIVEEYGDRGLTVYAINIREDGDPKSFIEDAGYTFTLLLDGDAVAKQYGIFATPGLLIVDRENRIVFNLYKNMPTASGGEGEPKLSHRQRAARRAPFWAARIRQALDKTM